MKKTNKPITNISQKQLEMLTERIADGGGMKPIVEILGRNLEFSMFTATEYRFYYDSFEGAARFELRPTPTDISNALEGIKDGTVQLGRLENFDIKHALEELQALGTLEIQFFSFCAADQNSSGDEGSRFIIEGELSYEGRPCPITLAIYVDQPFEDAAPVAYDAHPPE